MATRMASGRAGSGAGEMLLEEARICIPANIFCSPSRPKPTDPSMEDEEREREWIPSDANFYLLALLSSLRPILILRRANQSLETATPTHRKARRLRGNSRRRAAPTPIVLREQQARLFPSRLE